MTSVIQINKKTNGINFLYKNRKKITQEPHQQTTITVHRFCLIFLGAHERMPIFNQGSCCSIISVLNLFCLLVVLFLDWRCQLSSNDNKKKNQIDLCLCWSLELYVSKFTGKFPKQFCFFC